MRQILASVTFLEHADAITVDIVIAPTLIAWGPGNAEKQVWMARDFEDIEHPFLERLFGPTYGSIIAVYLEKPL
jgi:hypothetical protein